VLPGCPRIQACVRPAWFNGAPKIKSKIKIKGDSLRIVVSVGRCSVVSIPMGMPSVGASLLAKNVNDNACFLNERGACEFFASKLAPTKSID
ncbi:hypothetical protein, partial [Pseudomonas fluorescens]|uniref:hypothetical protein n=1 Tax=Pseudomonas fluorescens TaxID=294 RepID=UPI001A7EAF90